MTTAEYRDENYIAIISTLYTHHTLEVVALKVFQILTTSKEPYLLAIHLGNDFTVFHHHE